MKQIISETQTKLQKLENDNLSYLQTSIKTLHKFTNSTMKILDKMEHFQEIENIEIPENKQKLEKLTKKINKLYKLQTSFNNQKLTLISKLMDIQMNIQN